MWMKRTGLTALAVAVFAAGANAQTAGRHEERNKEHEIRIERAQPKQRVLKLERESGGPEAHVFRREGGPEAGARLLEWEREGGGPGARVFKLEREVRRGGPQVHVFRMDEDGPAPKMERQIEKRLELKPPRGEAKHGACHECGRPFERGAPKADVGERKIQIRREFRGGGAGQPPPPRAPRPPQPPRAHDDGHDRDVFIRGPRGDAGHRDAGPRAYFLEREGGGAELFERAPREIRIERAPWPSGARGQGGGASFYGPKVRVKAVRPGTGPA